MSWAAPQLAWLLLVPVALALFLVWAEARRQKRLDAFVALRLAERLVKGAAKGRRRTSSVLLVLAALFASLAMLRPTWGFHWEEVPTKGRDLYVLLDISRSMLAQDVSPDRITWAKRKILDLAALLPGDRIGIIAFSGSAFLACPPTSDSQALPLFLDTLGPESTTGSGTAISSAIDLAVERLGKVKSAKTAVLLLSDGEDHDGGAEQAAKKAAAAGVSVFALGVGKPEGAPIPERGGGFKKTPSGEMVLTRLDEGALQHLARSGSGAYWRSQPGDSDLQAVVGAFTGEENPEEGPVGKRAVPEERFQWPLALALFLLLAETLVQDGLPRLVLRRALTAALLFAGPMALGADVNELYKNGKYEEAEKLLLERQVKRPDDRNLLYDLGSVLYREGKFEEADKAFAAAAEKSEGQEKSRAVYNRGNAAFRGNKLEDAIGHFETALAIDPKDEDAKYNLALAKKKLAEQQKQQQEQKQGDPKDSKDGDKQDQKQQQAGQDQKGQDQKNQEQKEGEQKDSKQAEADAQKEKEQKAKQAEAGKKDDKAGDKKGEEQKMAQMGEMPKEEAQALLSRLREKRNARQGKPKPGGTPGGKDW